MGLKVFIASTTDRAPWLAQCVKSLGGREVTVVLSGSYELGKLQHIFQHHDDERFLFLQDSVEVLSEGFWARLREFSGSVGLLPDPHPFGCYMGVYERKHLAKMPWPAVESKEDSIRFEVEWAREYAQVVGGVPVVFPELTDASGFHMEHLGRSNLVLENAWFRKWKGTHR